MGGINQTGDFSRHKHSVSGVPKLESVHKYVLCTWKFANGETKYNNGTVKVSTANGIFTSFDNFLRIGYDKQQRCMKKKIA